MLMEQKQSRRGRARSEPDAAGSRQQASIAQRVRTELQHLGTKARSIRDAALADCEALFEADNVKGRFTPRATQNERIKAAHDALLGAIGDQPTSDDRLIAEAILAAGRFEGLIVEQRKELLEQENHISKDVFKKRRPVVMEALVDYLFTRAPQTRDSKAYGECMDSVLLVGKDVNVLCARFAASLFVLWTTRYLIEEKASLDHYRRSPSVITDALAHAHVNLILSGYEAFGRGEHSRRDKLLTNFPSDFVDDLDVSLREFHAKLPVKEMQRGLLCRQYFWGVSSVEHERSLRADAARSWRRWSETTMPWLYSTQDLPYRPARSRADAFDTVCHYYENVRATIRLTLRVADNYVLPYSLVEESAADYYGVDLSAQLGGLTLGERLKVHQNSGRFAHEYEDDEELTWKS